MLPWFSRCVLLLLFALPAFAKTRVEWSNVQIGAMRLKPSNWETSTSIQLGWTPMLDLRDFAIRGELGVAWPKDGYHTRFAAFNYEIYAMVPVWSFVFAEVGGGLQTWRWEGMTTRPILSGGLALRVAEWIDRVYIGYSRFFFDDNPVDQFRAGLAINIFE